MAKYKGIPVSAAKEIAKKYDKDQVIIVTFDKTHGKTHVTTYGKTVKECEQAAMGGNFIKKALGWPENECKAMPKRAIKKKKEFTLASEKLSDQPYTEEQYEMDNDPLANYYDPLNKKHPNKI